MKWSWIASMGLAVCAAVGVQLASRQPLEIPVDTPTDEVFALFSEELTKASRRAGVVGAAVGITADGQDFLATYGFQDEDRQQAVTEATPFRVGSISKPFTAYGVLRMAQQGQLELHQPAEDFLQQWQFPDSSFDTGNVTIDRLLRHTAGTNIAGYSGYPALDRTAQRPFRDPITPPQNLAEQSRTNYPVTLIAEPGERRIYSGGGYSVLQMLIEDVNGQSFSDTLDELMFRPLDLQETWFGEERIADRSAAFNARGRAIDDYAFLAQAAAGLTTSPRDMTTFLKALNNPEEGLLSSDTYTAFFAATPQNENFAMGLTREASPRGWIYGHGGNSSTWHAKFHVVPESGDGFFFLTNTTTGAQLDLDLTCAWRGWIIGRPTRDVCADAFALTRNLSLAGSLVAGVLALVLTHLLIALVQRKRQFTRLPRRANGNVGVAKIFAAVTLLPVATLIVGLNHSDFFYYRPGVTFTDEIPLYEASFLFLMIECLVLLVLMRLWTKRAT